MDEIHSSLIFKLINLIGNKAFFTWNAVQLIKIFTDSRNKYSCYQSHISHTYCVFLYNTTKIKTPGQKLWKYIWKVKYRNILCISSIKHCNLFSTMIAKPFPRSSSVNLYSIHIQFFVIFFVIIFSSLLYCITFKRKCLIF